MWRGGEPFQDEKLSASSQGDKQLFSSTQLTTHCSAGRHTTGEGGDHYRQQPDPTVVTMTATCQTATTFPAQVPDGQDVGQGRTLGTRPATTPSPFLNPLPHRRVSSLVWPPESTAG